MAWKLRRGKRYYYHSRRVGDRVVTEYLGRGPAAEMAAKKADEVHTERRRKAAAERELQLQAVAEDAELVELTAWCDVLFSAALLVSGYRKHRGEWRRTRRRA